MIRSLILGTLALAASGHASATNTDPLDFDYQVVARASERPALVFNDGLSTYIQPRSGQAVHVGNAVQAGPYWIIEGVPDVVQYTVNGQPVVARWKRSNSVTVEPVSPTTALPTPRAAAFGRMALIGSYATLPLVRAGRSSLPLAQMVKSIAPPGWTGTAQKEIPLTDDVFVELREGENWLQALARVLERRDLYAEVDFSKRNISLRAVPPTSFSLVANAIYEADTGSPSEHSPALATGHSGAVPASAPDAVEGPTLASAFGAVAIRDNKDGSIEIRFDQEPKDLVVLDPSSRKLWTKWDEDARVLSFATVDRFTATSGGNAVEVLRVPEIEYLFPAKNSAGLRMVFEKDGATYLSFDRSLVNVSVVGDQLKRDGEQRDRYYKFEGIASRLTVVADGQVVQVERNPRVRFTEQPLKVSL